MSHQITISPSGHQCTAADGSTVLDAALDAGFLLPYSCRNGTCGACRGRLLSGQVDPGRTTDSVLLPAEREAGFVLFCCAQPQSDITIECREFQAPGDIQVKRLNCRVSRLYQIGPDVMRLQLELPFGKRLQFLAGQYVDIVLSDGRRRAFSLANAPHDDQVLELHIRRIPGGEYTSFVFDDLRLRDQVVIDGPHGSFCLPPQVSVEQARPILLVAGGTGFAPIKAMVEDSLHHQRQQPLWLYWGARQPEGLYMHELAQEWAAAHPHIHYVPVVSGTASGWAGRQGRVHQAVLADWPDLSGCEVYLCGSEGMTATAKAAFYDHGLDPRRLHCDVFCAQSPADAQL